MGFLGYVWAYALACFFLLGASLLLYYSSCKTEIYKKIQASPFWQRARFLFLVVLCFWHVEISFLERVKVKGQSMSPELADGQGIWIEKISMGIPLPTLSFPFGPLLAPRLFGDYGSKLSFRRGEIIVFSYPKGKSKELYIKRLIALPQERYKFHKNSIYIQGLPLQEEYLDPEERAQLRLRIDSLAIAKVPPEVKDLGTIAEYYAQFGIGDEGVVPEGALLVLGDKRSQSRDSRSFGFIPISYVRGRVFHIEGSAR